MSDFHYFTSIDPGLNHTAYANWHGYELVEAGLVRMSSTWDRSHEIERSEKWRLMGLAVSKAMMIDALLVVEIPQVYTREQSKGDPNDLIDLAGVCGAVTQHATEVVWSPKPREWKGNLPKEITAQRVMNALRPHEHKAIKPCPPSLMHNVYDAVHLGLTYLKREGLRA